MDTDGAGKSYHTDSDGVILKNAWYQEGYDWYYAGEDGASVTHSKDLFHTL